MRDAAPQTTTNRAALRLGAGCTVVGAELLAEERAVRLPVHLLVLEADDHIGGRSQRTELAGWPTTTGGEGWWDFYDQGTEGACVGFGCSRMMSLLLHLAGHPTEPFDETFEDNGTANVLVAAS